MWVPTTLPRWLILRRCCFGNFNRLSWVEQFRNFNFLNAKNLWESNLWPLRSLTASHSYLIAFDWFEYGEWLFLIVYGRGFLLIQQLIWIIYLLIMHHPLTLRWWVNECCILGWLFIGRPGKWLGRVQLQKGGWHRWVRCALLIVFHFIH